MQFLNTILRFVATLILAAVVLLLPASLLVRSVGALAFDPDTTKELIRRELLDGDLMARVASRVVQSMLLEGAEGSEGLGSALVDGALEQLDEAEWAEIVNLVAPPELITQTGDTLIDAYAEWLRGDEALPSLQLDLNPWKVSLSQNAGLVAARVLDSLPNCTLEEMASQAIEGLSEESLAGALPVCRPPEPLYSAVLANADGLVAGFSQGAPDQINLDLIQVDEGELEPLLQLKDSLNRTRLITTWSWLAVLGVGAAAVLMAARSWPAALIWAGRPLLAAGLITLLMGLGIYLLAGGLLERLLTVITQDGPALLGALVGAVAGGALRLVALPLTIQGLVLSSLGGGALWARRRLLLPSIGPDSPPLHDTQPTKK